MAIDRAIDRPIDRPMVRPGWTVIRHDLDTTTSPRVHDALFALSDGTVGVRGGLGSAAPGRAWLTLVAGAFGVGPDGDTMVRLLPGPSLTPLAVLAADEDERTPRPSTQWTLDLRSGVLEGRPADDGHGMSSIRFVSLTRPGLVAERATGGPQLRWSGCPLQAPQMGATEPLAAWATYCDGELGDGVWWAETRSDRARIVAVSRQRSGTDPNGVWLERLSVFRGGTDDSRRYGAERALSEATGPGFDDLLAEHRAAWSRRWDAADIEIDGDDGSQEAIRFALFHLLSCAPTGGEAGVGARGLSGPAYAGHVFWDADVFVLPVLAATAPDAARAMIGYRVRRLSAAQEAASTIGRAGARFPWESADTGHDATPTSVRDHDGRQVGILTGSYEEHINTDIAWATLHYVEWTGDTSALEGALGPLVTETARYWASRIRLGEDGRAHLDQVMGPDEYHEIVDDNAFTNITVRWHLRRAATMIEAVEPEEASRWRHLANKLIDGFDPATGRHEQFTGFWDLEPLRIADFAEVPIAADVLLGRTRVAKAQVLKQPDVLMAHHLVPEELPAGSLEHDLDFYVPRTSHGSSLSPAICACLLARAGRPDEALELFDIAARLDLDDLTGTTGSGLHLGTFGGLWQAVVFGFGGIRPGGGVLRVEPALPARWTRLQIRIRFRKTVLRIELAHDRVVIDADGPVSLVVCGIPVQGSSELVRDEGGWKQR
ncbi:MAG: glycosyl hydrolase family 65 protein [Acidimicrobiales bacterium]